MESLQDLALYFYIACGIGALGFLIVFVLLIMIFTKLNRQSIDKSNQLSRQTNMMMDFCYTNPEIVPGEELSRRGFSMYSGSDHFGTDLAVKNGYQYGTYNEARSKF